MITAIEPIPSERAWIARLLRTAAAAPTESDGGSIRRESRVSDDEDCLP